jgi:hypothetical protein
VLFCNHEIKSESPRLLDLAPTVLELFGCKIPEYMDGRPMVVGERRSDTSQRAGCEIEVEAGAA